MCVHRQSLSCLSGTIAIVTSYRPYSAPGAVLPKQYYKPGLFKQLVLVYDTYNDCLTGQLSAGAAQQRDEQEHMNDYGSGRRRAKRLRRGDGTKWARLTAGGAPPRGEQ